MKMRWFVIFLFLLIPIVDSDQLKVEDGVNYAILTEGKADVIVVLNTESNNLQINAENEAEVLDTLPSDEFEEDHQYAAIPAFSGTINSDGLNRLKNNPKVKKIYLDINLSISLTQSLPLINATVMHSTQINNINMTGYGETICIIDTGINYTVSDLGGGLGLGFKVLDGYNYINDTIDPMDDNGHGTHVAGVAASNGSIIGVAPEASLIAIKSCDHLGGCPLSDVAAGIDWCLANQTIYNISVISMSLGDGGSYNPSNCPTGLLDDVSALAFDAGIFLTAAAGNNDASTNGISYPACNENITAVGAVNDNDGLNYSRGSLLNLLAPGITITSLGIDGSSSTASGTSASTPHVAGSAALLLQYKKEKNNITLTPSQIEEFLNETGKDISEGNNTFQRIDVYEAFLYLETNPPILTFDNPQNITYLTNISLPIDYTTSDLDGIDSVWYEIDNTNTTITANITFNLSEGEHHFILYSNDTLGNENFATIDFTADLTVPKVYLESPLNNSASLSDVIFQFSADDSNLNECSLYGDWNGWHQNQTLTVNNNSIFSFSQISLDTGNYLWNVLCNDVAGNSAFNNTNFTLEIDNIIPTIFLDSPTNKTYSSGTNLNLDYSYTESNFDSAWYFVDSEPNLTLSGNTTFDTSEDSHTLFLFLNDTLGNENLKTIVFFVDLTFPEVFLESPSNDSSSSSRFSTFNFNTTDAGISSCTLLIDNIVNNTDSSISMNTTQSFTIPLIDGNYTWGISCLDNAQHATNSSLYDLTVSCSESWDCTGWTSCSGSTQTRDCTDSNKCGTVSSKPAESQSCTVSSGSSGGSSGGGGGGGGGSSGGGGISVSSDKEETPKPSPIPLPTAAVVKEVPEPEVEEPQEENKQEGPKPQTTGTFAAFTGRAVKAARDNPGITATATITVLSLATLSYFFFFKV